MPLYDYRCTNCGKEIEVLQKISDPAPSQCPACGQATLSKKLTAAGFQLKGSGWYATDFKGGGATQKPLAGTERSDTSQSSAHSTEAAPPPCANGPCPACG
ncbi:zinc ribbon domain-containing protein [Ferrovum sp.]|uniref:FmdB family zinc ribbon protein n=1 Tax=Ferrovum sp. TaxID=2609467 RepID=UPI00260A299E|nr:zinc ribbon domain-containing protein [Ferrovum sp.]